jgi:putative polyketide hydroxylase
MKTIEIPVLIVGGGPVGLCTSALLSRHGVPSLLVERHTGTSLYPKARLINTRTMEIFRECGLEQAVREISLPPEQSRHAIWARTLAGEELQRRTIATVTPDLSEGVSPTFGCTSSQEVLEPILLTCARQFNLGEVRFGTELTTFVQDGSGVSATILDRVHGEETQVRAQYLIGADGAHSRVREVLGILMVGPTGLGHTMNILFRADLTRWVAGRSINLCMIQHPDAPGVLLAVNGVDRWYFQAFYSPAAGQRAEDFTPERCAALVRTAVGVPDLPVEVLRAAPWSPAARVAARFREGRVFLAGDSAHEMTPAGGFGMNTGIQDAHNLSWKLAAVLGKWAGPALLETYERERKPVDRWITEQTLHSLASLRSVGSVAAEEDTSMHEGRQEFFHEQGMVFGAAYESTAVVPDGTARPVVANPVTEYVQAARPGSRAPHVWLERAGQRLSTLDLFGTEFVLLAGQSGAAWCQAAAEIAHARRIPLHAFIVGPARGLVDPDGSWATTYGVEQDGTVLVRPDGHVAWRSRSRVINPTQILQGVQALVLGEMASQQAQSSV